MGNGARVRIRSPLQSTVLGFLGIIFDREIGREGVDV
jgi:hypothetical protein